METEEYLNRVIDAVVRMDKKDLADLVSKGIAQGIDPLLIVNAGLTLGLRKVGVLFADEAIFLPELILAGQMVTEVMESLKPQLSGDKAFKKKGLFLIATVKGDIHDLGKNLVALLLSASGYEVVDLGKDVPAETILEKVNELSPQILGLSALLSTTMPAQREVIQTLEEAGVREKVKIIVGGAPVTRDWAREIGADGYAEDASTAVDDADRLMGLS
ncbi:MAG: corrinoid protein [Desulfobacterales bacterium]|nr:corrinoid protein [Desulfobacterales bacterium]